MTLENAILLPAMKKQGNIRKTDPATLDGAAVRLIRCVGNPTIDAAAVALDALAIAAAEYGTAKLELENAEAEAAKCGAEIAERIKAVADRLRAEADRRRADADAYGAGVSEKCLQVAKIHPMINGVLSALMQYATGEARIDGAVTALINGWPREFTPEVTDANRAAVAAFKPVRRNPPDTSALEVPDAVAGAFARLEAARTRYDTACRTLADALYVSRDCNAALADEAATEAESVKRALELQAERDA